MLDVIRVYVSLYFPGIVEQPGVGDYRVTKLKENKSGVCGRPCH